MIDSGECVLGPGLPAQHDLGDEDEKLRGDEHGDGDLEQDEPPLVDEIDHQREVVLNDPELVISAALEGIGVAYLYEEYVASLVADGRLVSLLDKSVLPVTDGFFLFYPSRRQNPAALRALIEFLRSDLRASARTAKAKS